MLQKGRFEKTMVRNIADLDDHLYFLKDDLTKLIAGDEAYVKKIASELRTLVCLSSKTEGLLWRVAEEMELDVGLNLQAPTGIDKSNPMARGLSFVLIPVFRAGEGPRQFKNKRISYKKFVKEYEALYYNGQSYTHEQLISGIAQQIGLSHESEDVAPHLIDLSGVALSNRPALVDFLLMNASFTIEIGERILEAATLNKKFVRKNRGGIIIPSRKLKPFQFVEKEHFVGRDTSLPKQGFQFMVCKPPNPGWETDGRAYHIGSLIMGGINCIASKHSDGTLEVIVYGLSPKILIKRAPVITRDKPEIVLILTWNENKVRVIIDGNLE